MSSAPECQVAGIYRRRIGDIAAAQALLRKIDARQEKEGRATNESPADKQKVMDFPTRPSTVAIA